MDFADVFQFLTMHDLKGEACVLVTVVAVEGSSMRNPGTVMGVAEDGSFAGSLSGGCIENAVVAEALETLKAGTSRVVRFGAGSPYLDIKLPCGGGLDVHFQPLDGDHFAKSCLESIRGREPFSIELADDGASHIPNWHSPRFDLETGSGTFGYWPTPRLLIIGHGAGVEALNNLARKTGCATSIFTSDERLFDTLTRQQMLPMLLTRTSQIELLESDPWTAITFLFHDHDWEIDLMARALELPHFYLGAMGGRKAHAMRCAALRKRGITDDQLATIRAPIGLFHSSRDPQTLALSALAEVIKTYQDFDFDTALG